jgi:hypothetical protein
MKVVYKYVLEKTEVEYDDYPVMQTLMPIGSKIIKIGFKNAKLCVWAIVDKNETKTYFRSFLPLGTGIDIPEVKDIGFVYQNSTESGPYVFHVFEVFNFGAA